MNDNPQTDLGVVINSPVIASAGGIFTSADGRVAVDIPANAMAQDSILVVTEVDVQAALDNNVSSAGEAFAIDFGTSLLAPAELTLGILQAPEHPTLAESSVIENGQWVRQEANFFRASNNSILSFVDTSGTYQAMLRTLQTEISDSVDRGEEVFLDATFGNEDFFGGAIGLHELLNNLSPSAAVGVGAQIDVTRVPQSIVDVLTGNDFAAKQAALANPAVTRALLKLESEVGGALIRREGKHTHLTPFGKMMRQQFELLAEADQQTHQLAQEYVGGSARNVKIAIMCTIGPNRFSGFLAQYCQANPNTQITLLDLEHASLVEHLLDGHVDCALVGTIVDEENRLRSIELYRERLMVAHSRNHAFSARESVSIADITREPYLDRLKCDFRSLFLEACKDEDLSARSSILCENDQWIQSLIRIGAGVSIMPEESVIIDGVATTAVEGENLHRSVSLVVATGREDTEDIRNFMQAARAYSW